MKTQNLVEQFFSIHKQNNTRRFAIEKAEFND